MPNEDLKKLKKSLEDQNVADQKAKHQQKLQETALYKAQINAAKQESEEATISGDWTKLKRMAEEMNSPKGYDTWLSGMLSILELCHQFQKVNPIGGLLEDAYQFKVKIPYLGQELSASDIVGEVGNQISSSMSTFNPKVTLPDLQHFVEFTNDNKLNVDSISNNFTRADGKKFSPEDNELLKIGVMVWLSQNGYEPKEGNEPNVFVKKENTTHQLTKAEFEALRDDPVRGLNKFLNREFEMKFEQIPDYSKGPAFGG